jgi:hypothetical protein
MARNRKYVIMVGNRYVKEGGDLPVRLTVLKASAEKFSSYESARVALDRLTAAQMQRAQIFRA